MPTAAHHPPGRQHWATLAAIGAAGGLLSGALGVGGGILMIPLLIGLARMDDRRASATSLAAIVPTALAGALAYLARGQVDVALGAILAVGGVGGAWLGAGLLRRIPLPRLRWMFVGLLVLVAARMVLTVPTRGGELELTPATGLALVAVGVFMGVTSGLFGIGGAVVLVPALVLLFGVDDLLARGTSLLVMLPTAATGTVAHLRAGRVDVRQGTAVGLAATAASFAGVAIAFAVPARPAAVVFAVLLLVAAGQLAGRALRARPRP